MYERILECKELLSTVNVSALVARLLQFDRYLSRFPDIYSNVSVLSVVRPHLLGRYFNT